MTKRMLIDASHAEETRVVVLDGTETRGIRPRGRHQAPAQGQHLPGQGGPGGAQPAGRLRGIWRQPARLPRLQRDPSGLLPDPRRRPAAPARDAGRRGARGGGGGGRGRPAGIGDGPRRRRERGRARPRSREAEAAAEAAPIALEVELQAAVPSRRPRPAPGRARPSNPVAEAGDPTAAEAGRGRRPRPTRPRPRRRRRSRTEPAPSRPATAEAPAEPRPRWPNGHDRRPRPGRGRGGGRPAARDHRRRGHRGRDARAPHHAALHAPLQDPGSHPPPADHAGPGGQGGARHQGRGADHLHLAGRPLLAC